MELSELYLKCRTFRKFTQQEIPEKDIDAVLNNLRYVHSGNNKQELRYIAVLSKKVRHAVSQEVKFAALLPRDIADPKPDEEPTAYIIIVSPAPLTRVNNIDTGIAAEYIVESAYEKGIGSCMMLNYCTGAVNEILHLSKDETSAMVIALGYPSHTSEAVDMINDDTSYTCDPQFHYKVPKRAFKDIVKKI